MASKIKHHNAEYAGVTLPTLRAWLRYWQGVEAGTRTRNKQDEGIETLRETRKLSVEIGRRTA